jgi:hypothetical protein
MSVGSIFFNNNPRPSSMSTTQYVYSNTGTSYSQLDLSGNFTIEFWMKADAQVSLYSSIIAVNTTWGTNAIDICAQHDVNPGYFTIVQDINSNYYYTTKNVCDGVWHNIAIVRISNLVSVYIDGILRGTPTTYANVWSLSKFALGAAPINNNTDVTYAGYMSNLRIVNSGLYTSNYSVPTTPYGVIPGTLLLMSMSPSAPLLDQSSYNVSVLNSSTPPTVSSTIIPPISNASGNNGTVCFKEGSQILTQDGYVPVENLSPGHLIKTVLHGFVPIEKIGKKRFVHQAILDDRIKDQLYVCRKEQYPELTDDLVLTGCHGILVKDFVSDKERENTIKINGDTYVTDGHYRLPVCVDERASVFETAGEYTIYHFSLKHENYYMNYGVYANGLLVETTCMHNLNAFSNMEYLE